MPEQNNLNWTNIIFLTLTPIAALIAVPLYAVEIGFTFYEWFWFGFFMMATGIAITAGYHRLWSHKTYETHFLIRLWHAIWGACACQNSILNWSIDHRLHHRFVDQAGKDPYAASRGLWYSHIGWILRNEPRYVDDKSNVKDLLRDPIVRWQHKHYIAIAIITNAVVPLALGFAVGRPLGVFILAFLLRVVLNHHFTFFINSLAHFWGRRPYSDKDTSRDNPLLALFTYGEGYHNYHHTFQHDYRNGIRWWHYDPSKWMIRFCSWIGLARGLKRADKLKVEQARARMQLARALARLDELEHHAPFRTQLEQRYEGLVQAMNEWGRVRRKWLEVKNAAVAEKLERLELRTKYLELKYAVRLRRQQWRVALRELAPA